MGFVLVWVSLEVEPETSIHVQAVYLEGNSKEHGGEGNDAGKGRQPIKLVVSCGITSLGTCRLWEVVCSTP